MPALVTASEEPAERGAAVTASSGAGPGAGRQADRSTRPGQTSEGIVGEIAPPEAPGPRPRARVTRERSWRVAPGIAFRRWDQTDSRGQIRAYLLTVNPAKAGVALDYAMGQHVPDRSPLTSLLKRDRAVAGINGGFFDISDTGAPLGVGTDPERGFLHASLYTWNNAFYLSKSGVPRIGPRKLKATIEQFPQIEITNHNSPRVREGKVGIYTPDWGTTSGYSITDGQTRDLRMVVIDEGRVQVNRTTLTKGKPIEGVVLVGRGPGAAQLRQLRVGSLATVGWGLAGDPALAISGERILLDDGALKVSDNRELHPRTAVGVDRDRGRVLMLVIDGRQSHSRGYTLVELGRMLRSLGAEDALNFDGGGSTTMVVTNPKGVTKVVNQPSDGTQRNIPDGLGVTYTAPPA